MEAGRTFFSSKLDAMRAFGFKGNGWQKAVWPIPSDSEHVLWLPWNGKYQYGVNTLNDDGKLLSDERTRNFPKDGESYGKIVQDKEHVVILRHNKSKFEFIGVFKHDIPNSTENTRVWVKTSPSYTALADYI